MIASSQIAYDDEPLPRVPRRGERAARGAAQRRRARTRAARRRGLSRLLVMLVVATVVGSGYLALLGNVMRMQIELNAAQETRSQLQAGLVDVDDRLARLESRSSLLHAAAQLRMHDPSSVALVSLSKPPPEQPAPSGIAFFGSWLR